MQIPVRHFDAVELDQAMQKLGVPMTGDFTQGLDAFLVRDAFRAS